MPRIAAGELGRKVVHVLVGSFALLLRVLTWPGAAAMAVAAFLFNWQVLPRIGGRGMWRGPEREKGYPLGILVYPLSVLALILVFRHTLWIAAALWGILAWGDGMASILGQALGGPRLPWNPRKGWVGLLAFVLFGTLAASFLASWTLGGASFDHFGLLLATTVLCGLVETVPTTLDDNLTVPLTGACIIALLLPSSPSALLERADLTTVLLLGLSVNVAVALLAYILRSIDFWGGLSAIVIGLVIVLGFSLRGFGLMAAFFVLGSIATKIGYRRKAARGIAQEKGGARGWRNAWANGGIAALLALAAALRPADGRGLLVLAYAAAVATATADTCSSEIGKAFGRSTFLITTFRPVPPGTEGAVSAEGTFAGLVGALLVGGLGWALGLYSLGGVFLVGVAGFLGGLAESVLGTVAEKRGWLDNNLLNAVNTAIGAGLAFACGGLL